MFSVLRPFLFNLDPETAHDLAIKSLKFNPLPRSMFEVEDEKVPTGTIVEQVQKGYTIHDRLLRPAMVGVSKGGKDKAADQIEKVVVDNKNQEKEQKGLKESSAAAYTKGSNKTDSGENPSPKIDKKL